VNVNWRKLDRADLGVWARSAAASLAQVFTEEADAADVQEAPAVLIRLEG